MAVDVIVGGDDTYKTWSVFISSHLLLENKINNAGIAQQHKFKIVYIPAYSVQIFSPSAKIRGCAMLKGKK